MRSQLGTRIRAWIEEDEFTGEEIMMSRKYPINLGTDTKLYGLEPDVQRIEWSGFYGPRGGWVRRLLLMSLSGLKQGVVARSTI